MLRALLAGGRPCRADTDSSSPCRGTVLPQGASCSLPTRGQHVRVKKGRTETHRCQPPQHPQPQSLANVQMQGPVPSAPQSLCVHPPQPSASEKSTLRLRKGEGVGVAATRVQAGDTELSLLPSSVQWAGSPPACSRIILLPCPVDVLEQGHGEGHAQDLKDKEKGLI